MQGFAVQAPPTLYVPPDPTVPRQITLNEHWLCIQGKKLETLNPIYELLMGVPAFIHDKYVYLVMDHWSSPLYMKLEKDGFFQFHPTNVSRRIFCLHQIIAFYMRGGRKAQRGFGFKCGRGEYEVHHIDGNGLNNHPHNLVILPSTYHRKITDLQSARYRTINPYAWGVNDDATVIINVHGRIVKDKGTYLARLAANTLIKTGAWLKGKGRTYVIDFANFLLKAANLFDLDFDSRDERYVYQYLRLDHHFRDVPDPPNEVKPKLSLLARLKEKLRRKTPCTATNKNS